MAQITTGIHGMLSHPVIYNLTQNILGVRRARRALVSEYMQQKPNLRMLDIGCGTAEILEFLPTGIRYVGFDVSERYIAYAKRRFGARGEFSAGLVGSTDLVGMEKFDVVLAFGVVHHLDDPEADKLFSLAAEALKDGGVLLTVDPCFMPGQTPLARWLITNDRGQNVRDQESYCRLAEKSFVQVESTPRHDFLRLPYTYLVMQCRNDDRG